MIYSVTLNPSIDFIVRVEKFQEGETNRAFADEFYAGGKGIMVSKLLKNIGTSCRNLGFLGGFTGKFIEDNLNLLNIEHDFVKVKENTRINVKLKSEQETEINCKGPNISEIEIQEFLKKIKSIKENDFVILSGSIPSSLGDDFYIKIIEILKENKVNFALDSSGEAFSKSLEYKPFLIKPNRDEISEYAGKKMEDYKEIINFTRENLLNKAEHIIISMGGEGALYVAKEYSLFAKALKGKLINSVGAGDSVVAGFVDSVLKGKPIEKAFKFAIACGTATAFSEDIGELDFIEEIKSKIIIERMV
ncbi:1-phosphofructokinase [Fusobacterium russii]|uniref:1-phosphofructokinase n=1 Tax=Fusobacterium russii TaxID=854 RepID=UPI0003A1673C|nr:1-phosphofructokinase [Fusobacterium russii]